MSIQNLRKRALKLIEDKQFKILSDISVNVFDQGETYHVTYTTQPGRTLQLCACTNHARHCNQPARCVHKILAEYVLMIQQKRWDKKKC